MGVFSDTRQVNQVINVTVDFGDDRRSCLGLNCSFQQLQSSLDGAAVGDGRTTESAKVGAVFNNTSQGCDVINVRLVIANQVGDSRDEVSVIVDSSSQLVQGVEQARSAID